LIEKIAEADRKSGNQLRLEYLVIVENDVAVFGLHECLARIGVEYPDFLRAAFTVTIRLLRQEAEFVVFGNDLDGQIGNESLHTPLSIDQMKLISANESDIRTVSVAVEIEILLGDNHSKLCALDKRTQ
jgi:hypothetical protein